MKFRTEYIAKRAAITLDPSKPVVLVGSCFSQNMAAKMAEHEWEAVNPLGTLYNPLSITMALDMMLDKEKGLQRFEKSLFQAEGLWNSWWFDSSFSSKVRENCVEEFKIRQKQLIDSLQKGKQLIVTFGTSIYYKETNKYTPVGNCHKQPASCFCRERLTASSMMSYWSVIQERLIEEFPGLKVIFTVSPVRHLKDGFEGNARSKAILLLGVEDICRYNENTYYFPAYEIMNDDLRDYRFYASDLAHPSEEAIEYIWEKFAETFLDSEGHGLLSEGNRHYKATHHRPKLGALGLPLSSE